MYNRTEYLNLFRFQILNLPTGMSSLKYDNGWYELLFLRTLLQDKKWQRRSSYLNEINTDIPVYIKQFRKNVKTAFFEKKSFLNSLKLLKFHFFIDKGVFK